MSYEFQAVLAIPIVVGLVGLLVGLYVYRKNPFLPSSRMFLIVMFFFFAYGPIDYAFMTAPDAGSALLWGRIGLFVIVLAFASIVYLASLLPYERFAGWFSRSRREYVVISLLAAFIGAYAPNTVTQYDFGWGFPMSEGFYIWMVVMVSFALAGIYMLTVTCLSTNDKVVRRQATILSFGIAFPYIYAIVISVLLVGGAAVPNTYSPGVLFLILAFAYAVMRYRTFTADIKPKKETVFHTDTRQVDEMKGRLILIEDKKSEGAHELFHGLVSSSSPGLLVTRMVPDLDVEGLRHEGITVLTISTQVGENRLDPTNLSILHHTIREFLRNNPSTVVLMDGLEYLFENNEADRVVKLVQSLRDEAITIGASLLISIDPDTITERYLSMFEREFDVVGPGKGAGTEI